MRFAKYHGLGNDFIIIEDMARAIHNPEALARRLCSRRLGIGADGLVLARPSERAEAFMAIYNSDGSPAEMCGNAIRCFAKYLYDSGLCKREELAIDTLAGVKTARLALESGRVSAVEVDMGEPLFQRRHIPMEGEGECIMQPLTAGGRTFTCCAVNTGVPHIVAFVEEISEEEILRYGPLLEGHPLFPRRANVNFARALKDGAIALDTWERGCGRTLACGTGACAAAVCAHRAGLTGPEAEIRLAHGSLHISRRRGRVYMRGPAAEVFTGELPVITPQEGE